VGVIAVLVTLIILALAIPSVRNVLVALLKLLGAEDSNPDKLKYLLSATAQVLGAVFAIVFSITPIVVQQLTRYISRPLRFVFNSRIIIYIAGFAVAITIPLWGLGNPTAKWALLSLVVGTFFIISLIWYFRYIIRSSSVTNLIPVFHRRCLEAIARHNEEEARDMVASLDGIAIRALSYREFEVFEQAETALADLLLEIERSFGGLDEGTP